MTTNHTPWFKQKKFVLPLICGSLLLATLGVAALSKTEESSDTIRTSHYSKPTSEAKKKENEQEAANSDKTSRPKQTIEDQLASVYQTNEPEALLPVASVLEKTDIEKLVEEVSHKEEADKPTVVLPVYPTEPSQPTVPEEPTPSPVAPIVPPTEPEKPVTPPVEPPTEPEKPVEPPVEPETPTPEAVDYRELRLLVGFVNQLNLEDYTPDSTQTLIRQLSLSQTLLSQQMGTQATVDAQVARLQAAIEALIERADFSKLEALINEVSGLDLSNFTDESVANLQTVLAEAQVVLSDKNSSQSVVSAMRARLQLAKMGLKEKDYVTPLKETLQGVINQAQGINRDDYLENSLISLDMAIAKAQAVISFSEATVDGVQAEIDNLNHALNSLVARPNKEALSQKLTEAHAMDTSGYTEDSVAVFNQAVADAGQVNENWFATQEAVDQALSRLEQAIQQLDVQPEEPTLDNDTENLPV